MLFTEVRPDLAKRRPVQNLLKIREIASEAPLSSFQSQLSSGLMFGRELTHVA